MIGSFSATNIQIVVIKVRMFYLVVVAEQQVIKEESAKLVLVNGGVT